MGVISRNYKYKVFSGDSFVANVTRPQTSIANNEGEGADLRKVMLTKKLLLARSIRIDNKQFPISATVHQNGI